MFYLNPAGIPKPIKIDPKTPSSQKKSGSLFPHYDFVDAISANLQDL